MQYFRIKNWEKYQHRDHSTTMPWIKLHTAILEDPKMFELGPYQFGVWCKLMLLCARVGNELSINQSYLRLKLGLSKPFNMALFESLGLIEKFDRADTAPTPRLDKRREDKDLDKDLDKEERRLSNRAVDAAPTISKEPDLEKLWNENCGDLPKIQDVTAKRKIAWRGRWRDKPEMPYWVSVIRKIAASSFCLGENDRGWKANVDFFLRPDTHVKAYEGRYDGKKNNYAEDRFNSNMRVVKNLYGDFVDG